MVLATYYRKKRLGLAVCHQIATTDVFRIEAAVPGKGQPAWGTAPVDFVTMRGEHKWLVIHVSPRFVVEVLKEPSTGLSKSSEMQMKTSRPITRWPLCRQSC